MRKFVLFCSIIGAPFAVAGCMSGPSTGTSQGAVMSCFNGSKAGLTCVDTPNGPETQAMDVDDDGKDDPFVCADRDHDDDGTPDFEDSHDDSGGGGSGSGSGSGSSVDGSHDGSDDAAKPDDKDGDGIDDEHDCGTTPPQPPV